jgi:hypothetical protein
MLCLTASPEIFRREPMAADAHWMAHPRGAVRRSGTNSRRDAGPSSRHCLRSCQCLRKCRQPRGPPNTASFFQNSSWSFLLSLTAANQREGGALYSIRACFSPSAMRPLVALASFPSGNLGSLKRKRSALRNRNFQNFAISATHQTLHKRTAREVHRTDRGQPAPSSR